MNKFSTTFPQALWKTLWKTAFLTLQVPEKFRLLAFCTRRRQTARSLRGALFERWPHTSFRCRTVALSLIVCAAFVNIISCVRLPRTTGSATARQTSHAPHTADVAPAHALLDINTATPAELERLPGIGQALAARIVEHRERFGAFRRAEHLIMVRGISDRRFRELRALVLVE